MRTTRATARAASGDVKSEDQTLSVVAENVPWPEGVPVLATEESALGAKDKKKKKGGKKNKKMKKTATKTEDVDENDSDLGIDHDNVPTKLSSLNVGSKVLNDVENDAEKDGVEVDEDPFIERPASPTVKHQFIAKLPLHHALRGMEEPENGTNRSLATDLNKVEATMDVLEIKTDVSHNQEAVLKPSITEPILNTKVREDDERPALASPTSHLTSPTIVGPLIEDPIEAIDALEDALEEVGKILPKIEPVSPEKKRTRTAPKSRTGVASTGQKAMPTGTKTAVVNKKATVSKPSSGASLLKTTQPSATSRNAPRSTVASAVSKSSTSLTSKTPLKTPAKPTSTSAKTSQLTTAPSTSKTRSTTKRQSVVLPPKDTKDRPDYLAEKRRPISMQFPPPPAPIKSAKPPTRPTFVLPSEALEEKRKAARAEREERRRKEEEELQKKREFKARPIPSNVISGAGVRQTASSLKRMSVMMGKTDASIPGADIQTGGKENTQPNPSTANKRASVMLGRANSVANHSNKRASMVFSSSIGPNSTQTSKTNKPSSTIILPKRQSVIGVSAVGALSSSTRDSSPAGSKTTVSQDDIVAQKAKAWGIYNRDKIEKETREKERREKEEAAKRARAEAAEKGRQASREWAEKQKRKALMAETARKASAGGTEVQV